MGRRPFFNLFLVTDIGLMPDLNALAFPDTSKSLEHFSDRLRRYCPLLTNYSLTNKYIGKETGDNYVTFCVDSKRFGEMFFVA